MRAPLKAFSPASCASRCHGRFAVLEFFLFIHVHVLHMRCYANNQLCLMTESDFLPLHCSVLLWAQAFLHCCLLLLTAEERGHQN